MKGLNLKQMEFAFRGKGFRESRWYRLFASKRWALLLVHWPGRLMIAFPPCPECGGKGKVGPIATDQDTWRFDPCPKCGGLGVEISDELVGLAAKAMWERNHDGDWYQVKQAVTGSYLAARYDARAVLAVVVAHLRDGTKERTE